MQLRRPPVVEAWIHFRFSLAENAPRWGQPEAVRFVQDGWGGAFKPDGALGHTEVTFNRDSGQVELRSPHLIFDRIRAANENDDRYVQVGQDELIYNLLRKQNEWPKYQRLRTEAMGAYQKYVEFMKPPSLLSVALHYRDVVSLPLDGKGQVNLGEYFTVYPEVPFDLYGGASEMTFSVVLPAAARSGTLSLTCSDERGADGVDGTPPLSAKFCLVWALVSPEMGSVRVAAVTEWLDGAHADMLSAFRLAFTDRAWQLFEPEDA